MSDEQEPISEDDFNAAAWASFVQWAWSEPNCRTAFTKATGLAIVKPAASPIDRLVDAATGMHLPRHLHDDVAAKFVEWVTKVHWGVEYAPKAYRQRLASEGST